MDSTVYRGIKWAVYKICKLEDDFVWRAHENEDELFMGFRDVKTAKVKGRKYKYRFQGVEHGPHTNREIVFNLLFEPNSTMKTGGVETTLEAKKLNYI